MKILFLTSNFIPPFSGDAIFSQGLAIRLANKHCLTLVSFGKQEDWNSSPASKNISDYILIERHNTITNKSVQIIRYGSLLQMHSFKYISVLKSLLGTYHYDYIIIDHLRTYSLYKSVKPLIDRTKSKLIYIAHNAEFKNHEQKLLNFTNRRKRLVYRLINRNIQKLELELVEESDFVWGLSQKDVDNLKEVSNVKNSLIVPPYFPWECQKDRATLGELSKKILILGSMQWYPNVEGALHFIDDIFPHVLQLDSNYKLYIVGQKPDQRLLDKQSDKIIVTGRVPSVDPYIKEADLLVIPNRFGSGIKIKLLESVIKGLPVIMYKENVDGYEHSEFKFPFVVKNSEEFIKAIFTINKNKSLKETFLNKHSQQFEEFKKFDFQL